jgi:hypothetical protein
MINHSSQEAFKVNTQTLPVIRSMGMGEGERQRTGANVDRLEGNVSSQVPMSLAGP